MRKQIVYGIDIFSIHQIVSCHTKNIKPLTATAEDIDVNPLGKVAWQIYSMTINKLIHKIHATCQTPRTYANYGVFTVFVDFFFQRQLILVISTFLFCCPAKIRI